MYFEVVLYSTVLYCSSSDDDDVMIETESASTVHLDCDVAK